MNEPKNKNTYFERKPKYSKFFADKADNIDYKFFAQEEDEVELTLAPKNDKIT